MSIDNLFTTQVSKGGQTSAQPSGKSAPGLSTQGMHFFDLFLQNAAQALENAKGKDGEAAKIITTKLAALDSFSTEGTKEQSIDVTELLAVNEQVEEDIGFMDEATLDEILALNQKELEGEIIPIEDPEAIVTDASQVAEEISIEEALMIEGKLDKPALFHLQRLAQKLEKLADDESPVLTALNITPEQITELKAQVDDMLERVHNGEKVSDILDGEGTEENAEGFAAILNFIKLMPPKAKEEFVIKGQGFGKVNPNFAAPQAPSNDLAARLNNLVIGVNDENFSSLGASDDAAALDDFEATLQKILKGEKGDGFGEILKDTGKAKTGNPALENSAGNNQTSKLQGWPFSLSGSLFAPMNYGESSYDDMGMATGLSTHSSTMSQFTSLVTQSQAAGQPHPGTQMIAAQIKKMAGSGETKNIRIQLDPPELGRVEIKMSFNKDKTMKAVLTAEKPETFLMMQRDSQALERALQDAGIEADGSELSFELAQDEQDFNQDGRHDGSRNEARGQGGENEEEIIESTMTWQVDPQTGHMRYNLLV